MIGVEASKPGKCCVTAVINQLDEPAEQPAERLREEANVETHYAAEYAAEKKPITKLCASAL